MIEPISISEVNNLGIAEKNTLSPEHIKQIEKRKEKLETLNQELDGKKHSVTDVPFNTKMINVEGTIKEGVFPEFDALTEVKLPDTMYKDSDSKQFEFCNKELQSQLHNKELDLKLFSKVQIEQIKNGDQPRDLVWHHNEVKGKMQLVDACIHQKTAHTGGRAIWGGGKLSR